MEYPDSSNLDKILVMVYAGKMTTARYAHDPAERNGVCQNFNTIRSLQDWSLSKLTENPTALSKIKVT